MSSTSKMNTEDQEIDLSQISKKIGGFFENISTKIFKSILFIWRHIIIIGILFIVGIALGIYLDSVKMYDNQIIVTPNYDSTDYLYSKIDLIKAKINEGDTIFLKEVIGIKNPKKILKIEIEPIPDVYRFIQGNAANFEFIKLLAEDGDIKKIVDDNLTSKNYPFHVISYTTKEKTSDVKTLTPLLAFLNNSDYYKKVQNETLNNIQLKMSQNDSIMKQIDSFLNSLRNSAGSSDKLVYYKENTTQLNDALKNKEELLNQQGIMRLQLINYDKIIKDTSTTINIVSTKSVNGKMKFLLPILFILMFMLGNAFVAYFKRQTTKLNN
ncbi:hypothetical protein [Flavobacterium sp. GT3R68]|uniref:hypothetical protein n=1 Tax=Flavobacterium sp. GT3R68 TaxID=2594437 RepID=UPI000F865493|nr:hypothetical protein [Flavobacterium sp. GT3R68]RTY95906.1 hypothetical protein EKL32_04470 [Flavobacterium sp. GSN2]TRW93678.1 hypothetical protein FNW07_01860 [Flavobacterium sp. GT3R68]